MSASLQKFYDPTYLPTHEDFFNVFGEKTNNQINSVWTEYSNMLGKENPVFEIWNYEYIRALSKYFVQSQNKITNRPIKILEVAAGNGRLTYFLRQRLEKIFPGKFELFATDSGTEKYIIDFSVEKLNHKEAIKKYCPDIIICSWMPMGIDLSVDFRKEKNLKEYILIGPARLGIIGTFWETWGISHVERKNIFGKSILPLYEEDGFKYSELSHINKYQICKMDTPIRLKRGIFLSTTVSFMRK